MYTLCGFVALFNESHEQDRTRAYPHALAGDGLAVPGLVNLFRTAGNKDSLGTERDSLDFQITMRTLNSLYCTQSC